MNKPLVCSLKMFRAVIGSHKIYCYVTLHPGRFFLPAFYMCIGFMMLLPRQARVFARLARWQLLINFAKI